MFLLPNYDKELLRRTHNAVVCSYSIQELKRVFNQKFPNQTKELDNFITRLSMLVEFVGVPENIEYDIEKLIRD
ncbi:MAG: hypothetical protein LBQ18_00600, partial [Campylobacteraceae bacterium]|nr:hypothetical protein [Campylobacteraceae bacterium]